MESSSGPVPLSSGRQESCLPQVHLSTLGSAGISTIQSFILPTVPKLYKYSAHQLKVVVQRRTGEVEDISNHLKNKKNDISQVPHRRRGRPKEKNKEEFLSIPSSTQVDLEEISLNDNNVESCKSLIQDSSKEHKEDNSIEEPTIPSSSSNSKASNSSECSTCEALITLLTDAEAQTFQLKEEVNSKNIKLAQSEDRISQLLKENKKLKFAVFGVKNGMNGLTKIIKSSNEDFKLTDKKISELCKRALEFPIKRNENSVKAIDCSLEKMRDHVSRLRILPPKSPSPPSFPILNNSEVQSLSFSVNLINKNNSDSYV